MKWTRAMREDLARRTHLLISDPGFGEAMAKAFIELEERTRWRYPPEMPTVAGRYVVISRQWGVVVDIWDREAGSAIYRWRNFPDVNCWQPLPEPAPKKEETM